MKKTKTLRGFPLIEFKDSNEVLCTIQESSSAMDYKIWLGAKEIGLQKMVRGQGWMDVALSDDHIANNRMHLTREQVAELLPILQHFVDTGSLPE